MTNNLLPFDPLKAKNGDVVTDDLAEFVFIGMDETKAETIAKLTTLGVDAEG